MDRTQILESLQSVLCDPDGRVCISGSDADRAIIHAALRALESTPAQESGDLKVQLCRLYASAYQHGHHDTVEGQFVDVSWTDRDDYWREQVEESEPYAALSARTAPVEGEPVAYKFQDRTADGTWQDQYWHKLPPWEHRNPVPLYTRPAKAEGDV